MPDIDDEQTPRLAPRSLPGETGTTDPAQVAAQWSRLVNADRQGVRPADVLPAASALDAASAGLAALPLEEAERLTSHRSRSSVPPALPSTPPSPDERLGATLAEAVGHAGADRNDAAAAAIAMSALGELSRADTPRPAVPTDEPPTASSASGTPDPFAALPAEAAPSEPGSAAATVLGDSSGPHATERPAGGETDDPAPSMRTQSGPEDPAALGPRRGRSRARAEGVDDEGTSSVDGLVVRGRRGSIAPGSTVLPPADQAPSTESERGSVAGYVASARALLPTRAQLLTLQTLSTAQRVIVGASVVVCLPLLVWLGMSAYAAPRWPLLLLVALTAVLWLSSIQARAGFGRSSGLLLRPVNGVLVACAGLLPPLSLVVLLVAPTGARRLTDAVVSRAIRLIALTSAAVCFSIAGLPGPISVTGALAMLCAPVAFWLAENSLATYVPGRQAGADDLGTWEPGPAARELGEASTGLAIVTAVVVNPVLALLAVPLVAGSVSAVLELARSREADLDRKTGLLNEPAFAHLAARELARARRTGGSVCLLTLDLDHLKALNETHGHRTGDAAIVSIARRIVSRLRITDLACRFGGEEFTVLLPDTSLDGARVVAERIRGDVEGSPVLSRDGSLVVVSVSIGVAAWDGTSDVAALRHAADDALQAAKRDGRNRVAVAVSQPQE